MAVRFRDRFFTPRVARAITSPLGILLAGAGAAVGLVAGLPIAAAAGLGAAAWAARVAVAIPRKPRGERIDAFSLDDPWRQFVREAQQAQARFARATKATRPGPLKDRLQEIGSRIDDGVRECWHIAGHGQTLVEALGQIDVADVRHDLAEVEGQTGDPSAERTAEALRAQLASAERMASVANDARNRLRLLDARLDEAVARAIELSVGAADDAQLTGLGGDVDNLVAEMEALRQALEETGGRGTAVA